jgi:hypothetical protein
MSEARVRIRAGWMDAGKKVEGDLLAGPLRDRKGQDWMCVQWDTDEDPDLHKAAGLEIETIEWKPVKP